MADDEAFAPTPRPRQVALQFHAVGPEAVVMVAGWAKEFDLAAVLGRLVDGRPVTVRGDDFSTALAAMPQPEIVLLNRRPLQVGSGLDSNRLAQANPGSLILQLGRHVHGGVRESFLGR